MKANQFNKSQIMKEAHYWRSVLGYTMSEAMKMAWRNAKTKVRLSEESKRKNEEYEAIKEYQRKNTRVADMSYMANTLTNYYASNAYQAD